MYKQIRSRFKMNSNGFTVLLIVLISIHISSARNIAPHDSFDHAKALLNQIYNDSLIALNNALVNFQTWGPAALNDQSVHAKVDGATEITKVSDEQLAALDQIKNAAAELGLDITPCLGETESSLNQLGEIEKENLDECADAQVKNTWFNFNAAGRKVRNIFRRVIDVTVLLDSCETTDEACITNVLDTLHTDTINIPDEINQELVIMDNTYAQGVSFIKECIVTYVYDIKDKGDDILDTIKKCVVTLDSNMNGS